jgi:hypothetical protein
MRVGRQLDLDFFKPGILAWGLIEVAMDTDKTTHYSLISQKPAGMTGSFPGIPRSLFPDNNLLCGYVSVIVSAVSLHLHSLPSRLVLPAQVHITEEPAGMVQKERYRPVRHRSQGDQIFSHCTVSMNAIAVRAPPSDGNVVLFCVFLHRPG